MSFFERLDRATGDCQRELFEIPFVAAAVRGDLSLRTYVDFLGQAYHHVRHTVPLLMATGARLPRRLSWLRDAIAHYIEEENGHEQWILSDIRAAGGDADAVERGEPDLPCELLVAYAYDTVQRGNPAGFFGMVHVLEGTSVRGASTAAERLQGRLGLDGGAFRYLSSHGALDVEHVHFFAGLMDRLADPEDQAAVLHASRVFFRLYGDVFRALLPARQTERWAVTS